MAELRARTAAKGWLTRAAAKLEALLERDDVASEDWRYEAQVVEGDFIRRLDVFDTAQAAVESALDEDEVMKDVESSAAFRESFDGLRARCRRALSSTTADQDGAGSLSPSAASSCHLKLPKLSLPTFSGDVREWSLFWESFQACVHQTDLPEVSKLSYLRSLVQGEARSALSGLALTGASYTAACEILCRRFGRPERLRFLHIEALLNVHQTDLQHLQDELLSHIRSLEGLGVEGEKFGVILTPLVLSRLPEDVRLEWARGAEGKEGDLRYLLEFLACEISRRDRSRNLTRLEPGAVQQRSSGGHPGAQRAPAGAPAAGSRSRAPVAAGVARRREGPPAPAAAAALQLSSETCCLCSGTHRTAKCPQWVGLDCSARLAKARFSHMCFCCLERGHSARSCRVRCTFCKGRHNTLLCFQKEGSSMGRGQGGGQTQPGSDSQSLRAVEKGAGSSALRQGASLASQSGGDRVVLPTATVHVIGSDGQAVKARVLFDSGADRTFITESLVKKISPTWEGSVDMRYAAFGGGKGDGVYDVFKVNVTAAICSMPTVHELEAVRVPIICSPLLRPRIPLEQLDHFLHLPLADSYTTDDLHIDILVGQDQYWSLVGSGLFRTPEGLVALETVFGWVICGRMGGGGNPPGGGAPVSGGVTCQLLTMTDIPVGRRLWSCDRCDDVGDSSDESVLKEFDASVSFNGSRYVVRLPWRADGSVSTLMANREMAEARLAGLSRRLDRDPGMRDRYDSVLQEMEESGIVAEVPDWELVSEHPTFYLPHRPVLKQTGSLKVRPVFDASAKGPNGVSLNDCVEVGPALTPSLVDVLLRFRRWRHGFSADIVKAFLQIALAREDQDVHRFLWQKEGRTRVMRFQRVTFGVACSPFLLNATIRHHLAQYGDGVAVTEMRDNFYCDDLLSGADSKEEVTAILEEACSVMQSAGMELKCSSDNPLQLGERASGASEMVKVLGVQWCQQRDTLTFSGQRFPTDAVVASKRVVLSVIARLFDPLGFLTPFIITAKCLFQQLWELQVGWDDALPESCRDVFSGWLRDCELLQRFEVPRCYSSGAPGLWTEASKELHVFADASPRAYGAVVYLRLAHPDGSVSVSFVLSKVRVAPLKRQSLPRLELLGCQLAAQLFHVVRSALRLPADVPCTLWTDSMIALGWVRGRPERWKQYVSHRVEQIQRLTPVDCWSHCSGSENPADMMTRGVSAKTLLDSRLWLSGPIWLADDAPRPTSELSDSAVVDEAVGSEAREPTALQSAVVVGTTPGSDGAGSVALSASQAGELSADGPAVLSASSAVGEDVVFSPERYGSLGRATRVLAWVLRFVRRARRTDQSCSPTLLDGELESARKALLRLAQADCFAAELAALRSGKEVSASSPIRRLSPFLDDGLLRVRGRLQFSELSYEERHPVIVPRGALAQLIVSEQHELMHHAGVATLMTAVRSEFWVLGLRAIARRVVRACFACRRQDAPALSERSAPLPRDRAERAPPFSVCGVDFAGPLFSGDNPRKKLYICLFTCAVTRAVHLELTEALSLEQFMLAFRRFAARRGVPSTVYSDNARTFTGADVLLRKYFGRIAPHWKFIAPLSPWWGGWWERLVRSVKTALRKTLGKRCLSRAELETVLCEVEACINSRPLTFVGDTPDCPNPLTPNHFLTGHSVGFQAKVAENPSVVSARALSERARVCELRMTRFWSVWRDEYLRHLPPAGTGSPRGQLRVGDPVLIREDKVPRLQWDFGVVSRVFPGRDGRVRSAEVRTKGGLKTRAVQRLHSLEVPQSQS